VDIFPSPILVVSPHSDDSEIGCGGTIARLTLGKHKPTKSVIVVLCGASEMKCFEKGKEFVVSREQRIKEFQYAVEMLAAHWVREAGLFAEKIMDTQLCHLIGFIETQLKTWKPRTMIIPAPSFHQDHKAVFEACIAAARPTDGHSPDVILRYELPVYVGNAREQQFKPNCFVDITDYFMAKCQAIKQHQSQLKTHKYLTLSNIGDWNKFRGFQAGTKYAEAFEIERVRL
jgi:LmbE family N-acetylglucosaminyl deacetylase